MQTISGDELGERGIGDRVVSTAELVAATRTMSSSSTTTMASTSEALATDFG